MVEEISGRLIGDQAVNAAQDANAIDASLDALEETCTPFGLRDQHQELVDILGGVPTDILTKRPVLAYWYGLALLSQARFAEGQAVVAAYIRDHGTSDDPLVQGRLLVLQALEQIFLGDSSAALDCAKAALTRLPPDAYQEQFRAWATRDVLASHFGRFHDSDFAFNEMIRWREHLPHDQHWWFTFVVPNRADLLIKTGRLVAARSLLEAQLQVSSHGEDQITKVRLALIGLEQGDADKAERWLQSVDGDDEPAVDSYWSLEAALVRAQLDRQLGRHADAIGRLYEIIRNRHLYGSPVEVMRPNVVLADIWIEQGQLALASHWLDLYSQGLDSWPRTFGHPVPRLVLANLAIAEERWQDALTHLESLVEDGQSRGHGGILIQVYARIALVQTRLGDETAARQAVSAALTCDKNEAFQQSYIVDGIDVRSFLANTAPHISLLETNAIPVVPVLSAREMEIMVLVRNGRKNQEIANQLFISVFTVKNHIANAFHRLGVKSRSEAIERIEELGLFDQLEQDQE